MLVAIVASEGLEWWLGGFTENVGEQTTSPVTGTQPTGTYPLHQSTINISITLAFNFNNGDVAASTALNHWQNINYSLK